EAEPLDPAAVAALVEAAQDLALHEAQFHEPGAGADGDEQCAAGDAERRRDGRDRTADAVGPFGHDRGLLDPLVETAVAQVGAERVAEAGRLPAAHAVTTPAAMLQRGSGAASAPPGPSSSTSDSLGAVRMTW